MNQRQRFEIWTNLPVGRQRGDAEHYEYVPTEAAWQAWQEAERQMIERCAKVCLDKAVWAANPTDTGALECVQAIRALGDDE